MVLIISNLYPSKEAPFYGSFVKNFVDDLRAYRPDVKVSLCVLKGRNDGRFKKLLLYLSFYIRIFYRLIFFRYDFIYVHLITHASIPIRIVSRFKKLKLIFNIHGEDLLVTTPFAQRLLNIAKPLLYRSKLIVVPSRYFKEITVREVQDLAPEKILVSASGGVKEFFFLEKKWTEKSDIVIGYVSRIDRGKGWNVFVEAVEILKNKGLKVLGLMIGGGLEVENLNADIENKNLDNVKYIGPIAYDKLPEYYRQMDLFVFPTMLRESLGLVGLEAMASSTPVIASHIGGITDYLADGVNGYFFEAGNAHDLAARIEKFINLDISAKKKMSEEAYKTAVGYKADAVSTRLYDYLFNNVI